MPIDTDGLSFEELLELNQRVVARLKVLESMQADLKMMRFNQASGGIFRSICCDG